MPARTHSRGRAVASLGFVTIAILARAAASGPLFQSSFIAYENGSFASSTAIGDLNGDGLPDLLTPTQLHAFAVRLSIGDGTFGPKADAHDANVYDDYSTWTADLDADGKTDAIWSDGYSLFVARGRGDGTFDPSLELDPSSNVQSTMALGDMNGDGKLDIVALHGTQTGGAALAVYAGLGGGSFAAPVDIAPPTEAYAIVVADFDGDGRLDIAAGSDQGLSIILRLPDGSYASPVPFGSSAYGLSVADLNHDGHADLVSDDHVYLGRGDGGFDDLGPNADGVVVAALGDLNGDGHMDAVRPGPGPTQLQVALGHGDGTFAAPQTYTTAFGIAGVAVGDLDGDGRSDVSAVSWSPFVTAVFFSNPDGSLGHGREFASAGSNGIGAGDLDGDGMPDLVTSESGLQQLSVHRGRGDGTFESRLSYANPGSAAIEVGDLDGDGRADIVTPEGDGVSVRLTQPGGVPGPATHWFTGAGCVAVAIGDLDGNGIPDLATCNSTAKTLSVLLGAGGGSFTPGPTYATPDPPQSVAIGDLDGDGHADLAVAGAAVFDVSVLLGTGGGSFGPRSDYLLSDGVISGKPFRVRLGDVDGDGRLDALAMSFAPGNASSGIAWAMRGTGTGALGAVSRTPGIVRAISFTAGDFDRDGRTDIAVPVGRYNTCAVYLGQADGSWGGRFDYGTGDAVTGGAVAAGDFDRNGGLDLAVTNTSTSPDPTAGTIAVLLNSHPGVTAVAPPVPAPSRLALAGARPNPSGSGLTVEFTLTDRAPARLELLDVAGRRLIAREVGSLGAGAHRIPLGVRPAPGLYFLRLTSGARALTARATVLP